MRILLLLLCVLSGPAFAACSGTNLLAQMTPDDRTRLQHDAAKQPFYNGNFWRATKDGKQVTLVGTYHLGDPRHQQMLDTILPVLTDAKVLLVEAGPDEEAALKARASSDPTLFIMTDTTLPTIMDPSDWDALSLAMSRRGVPAFMAAKFQPWYVTALLAVPPCMMAEAMDKAGLDHLVMEAAKSRGVAIRGLEPYDTVFRLFETFTREDQIAMLRASLAVEDQAEDYITTLADSYFAGESRLIWELMRDMSLSLPGYTPAQVDADLAKMEQALLVTRNQGWIPVIEAESEDGPIVVAFGALHLTGHYGIPYLLQQQGWTISPLVP
ncbi:MAG: TraB/GumN family protein [Paracoccaceae bacterium]